MLEKAEDFQREKGVDMRRIPFLQSDLLVACRYLVLTDTPRKRRRLVVYSVILPDRGSFGILSNKISRRREGSIREEDKPLFLSFRREVDPLDEIVVMP
jgi:hypothetical protein